MKRFKIVAAFVLASLFVGVIALALRVTMTGSGAIGHVEGWSILESCTPAMPGDSRGSMGTASVRAQAKSTSRFVMDNEALLESSAGSARMRVSEVAVDNLGVDLSLVGPAQFLNVDKTMPPLWFNDANDFQGFTYGSGTGQVASVYGIANDPVDGGVLIASYGTVNGVDRYKVIKYTSAGVYVTEFGAFGTGNGQFSGAMGIAVSPVDQAVWVSDGANNRIQKFTTADGGLTYSYSTKVGTAGTGNGQFGTGSMSLAVDASGNVYAGDKGNSRIQKFNSSATYQAQVAVSAAGGSSLSPYGVAYNSVSNQIVASTNLVVGATAPVARIEVFNTSLVLQNTLTPTTPNGASIGIGNISVSPTGTIWAHWFLTTFLVEYDSTGVEVARWQSLYPAPTESNTNLAVAAGPDGVYAMFRTSPITGSPYAGNYVTGFDFSPVLLSSAIQTYMEACDSTLNGWTLDYQATDYDVVFPGWSGNVWANLKELFATYNVELVADHATQTFIIRDIGSVTTTIRNFGTGGVTTSPVNLTGGRVVDVVYQQPRAGGGVVWDAATENVTLSIAAGARDTKILYTVNHPAELAQPVPTDTLPIQPGQYYVVDSTGAAVPAETWLAAGGNITLTVGDSPGTISASIIGPASAITGFTGPFSFKTGNDPDDIPALSIVGNGTFCTPQTFVRAGAGSQGQPFNSPFMDTVDRVCSRGHYPSRKDPGVTITFTCNVSQLPPMGQAVGTVFPYEQSRYRIVEVRWSNLGATVTAERHVTAGDWETTWAGETAATYEAYWAGYSAGDEQVQPLRHA